MRWKWREGAKSPVLLNKVRQFRVTDDAKCNFDKVIEEWIQQGWLQPSKGEHEGIIPLMGINKDKVRPVMDYRELNE